MNWMCRLHPAISKGINNFLDFEHQPWGPGQSIPPSVRYVNLNRIPRPAATIQFVEMAHAGEFAVADHVDVEEWAGTDPAEHAAAQLEINAHGTRPRSFESVANYGFLDGHAESLRFRDAFESFQRNRFDPAIAQ